MRLSDSPQKTQVENDGIKEGKKHVNAEKERSLNKKIGKN